MALADAIKLTDLEKHLGRCGYNDDKLVHDYRFDSGMVPLAGFASTPHDARSACIAVIESVAETPTEVQNVRGTGAPVVLAYRATQLEWWKQTTGKPERIEAVPKSQLPKFFDVHKSEFSPLTIYEGKTRRRLPGQVQLHFVDVGLMPLIEHNAGEHLSRLVGRLIQGMESALGRQAENSNDIKAVFKSTFWLLAAKMLRDKQVPDFKTIKLDDIDDVFRRVGRHYGDTDGLPPGGLPWRKAIEGAAAKIDKFAHLGNVSTEALAYLYENTLIPDEVRAALGTHSTPSALVDYMVWQLWPWIEDIPEDDRHVFEPACGHGAFLVAMLRQLRQWSSIADGRKRHEYLKKHLHGVEVDPFALEIAKLSLTLADVPYGNSWDLKQEDMFRDDLLERHSRRASILLANPPFEKFTNEERTEYDTAGVNVAANSKACEMLRRTIPHLAERACFGVVVPVGLLHSKEASDLRRTLLSDFELAEIDVFEDKLFEKGDQETAVLMGRRKVKAAASNRVWFRRVRNSKMQEFRKHFAFSSEEVIGQSRLVGAPLADMRLPELDAMWRYLDERPLLGDIATVGKGLDHKGQTLPANRWTVRTEPHTGDIVGFNNVDSELKIFSTPKPVAINLDPDVVLSYRHGKPTKRPQVLLNYGPVSRQAWRLKATLDSEGRALTSRFIAVRPKEADISPLYLWAILNSPVANAFAYCHLGKRDILPGMMQRMPLPQWSTEGSMRIEQAATHYRRLADSSSKPEQGAITPSQVKHALLTMDAAVLLAYELPPRLERQLLDLFAGAERKGVGCDFRGYYPPGMDAFVPLRELISEEYARATAGRFRKHHKPTDDPEILAALQTAAESFGEE